MVTSSMSTFEVGTADGVLAVAQFSGCVVQQVLEDS